MLALYYHDIGTSSCTFRKVVESEIMQRPECERCVYRDLNRAQRIEHVSIALKEAKVQMRKNRESADSILAVHDLIEDHDMWKCSDYRPKSIDEKLLIHCDALWVLSPSGIKRDQERARKNKLKVYSYHKQYQHNLKVICKVIDQTCKIYERYDALWKNQLDVRG